MMRYTQLKHQFVTNLPGRLEQGILYISIQYATVAHLCCCGCGVEVVTPLTPTDWKMTFDGETISLWPSIGNWNEECRSHYLIERSRVISALSWSDRRIDAEWQRNRAAKESYYKSEGGVHKNEVPERPIEVKAKARWWSMVKAWFW